MADAAARQLQYEYKAVSFPGILVNHLIFCKYTMFISMKVIHIH